MATQQERFFPCLRTFGPRTIETIETAVQYGQKLCSRESAQEEDTTPPRSIQHPMTSR